LWLYGRKDRVGSVDNARESEITIHQRLLDGDSVASEELVRAYLPRLVSTLRKELWQRDRTVLVDAAINALFAYVLRPALYDAEKSGLFTYLMISARGDLLNAVTRNVTRSKHEIAIASVEDERDRWNIITDRADPAVPDQARRIEIMYGRELATRLRRAITDPKDWRMLELMSDGVRDTNSYCEILGIEKLSPAEQRKVVKQNKDRLKKQLERFRAGLRAKD
jgi:RNA polymerase sigma-70 factor, ECF subfamily